MSVLLLYFCFIFGLLVFVAWSSGSQQELWSIRESPSKLEAGLLAVNMLFCQGWGCWCLDTVMKSGEVVMRIVSGVTERVE